MKKSRSKNKKNLRRRRKSPAFIIFSTLALSLCLFCGWMYLQARITHFRPADIYLQDLPRSFDGTKILYISDFKIRSQAEAKDARRLMTQLGSLNPDILLLGGDYGADSVFEVLNGTPGTAMEEHVADFIASLSYFHAPMGKFAVAGDADRDLQALSQAFSAAGVQCLYDSAAEIRQGSDSIHIAGLADRSRASGGSAKLSRDFSAADCVIALAHTPASYIDIRVSEAKGGGAWADLVLSGHTLGGQINLFGRTLRSFSDEEQRTLSGWHYPNDLPLLVSEGLGCEDIWLRLGSESQVHLITLHRQEIIG